MHVAISLIVVVISGFVLWGQFNTKTGDVRAVDLQVTGHNIDAVHGVTLERVNDADLQIIISLDNYTKANIQLDKVVDQVHSCASVKNSEDGELFEITVFKKATIYLTPLNGAITLSRVDPRRCP